MCMSQKDLDCIANGVRYWEPGVKIKEMEPGYDRDRLQEFDRKHPNGAKFANSYSLEVIHPPGGDAHTVVRRLEKNNKGKLVPGQIVVSMEEVFDAIDELHRGNNHMGQERTWTYCKDKSFNISQNLVKHYCKTCTVCCKKNPVTKLTKGSRKPIKSRAFRESFQFNLINFCKLRKRVPIGVLTHWILVIKDHDTGFIYLCALPRKQANQVTYKLQEIFGVIGYSKIMHSDNGKEFRAKIVLELLRNLNLNICSVYGQPHCPQDQGSVESMN
jgi:hypothetical protein